MHFGSNRDAEHAAVTLREAFDVLVGPDSSDHPDLDHILVNMLQYVDKMTTSASTQTECEFALLALCEPILHGVRVPEAALQAIRRTRSNLAQVWERECQVRAASGGYVGRR